MVWLAAARTERELRKGLRTGSPASPDGTEEPRALPPEIRTPRSAASDLEGSSVGLFGPAARDAVAISIKLHRPTAQWRGGRAISHPLHKSRGVCVWEKHPTA